MSAARNSSGWSLIGASFTERASLAMLAAIALTGLYWVYSFSMTPFVKGPPVRQPTSKPGTSAPLTGTSMGREMAERFLAHEAWAADAWYQVRTADAYVYFQSWATVEGNEKAVRLKPFAVCWLPSEKRQGEPPITISSEAAYVTFTDEFDISKIANLKVDSGGLEGNVLITGPDGLYATGRDFTFDEEAMRLWSDNQIEFAFQKHSGHARGLQIELIRGDQSEDANRPTIEGIRSIRLLRDVVMDLVSDRSERAPGGGRPPAESGQRKPPEIIKVRSEGSFEFVLETNIATLEDQVRIFRPNVKQQYDTIQSDDRIVILFEKKSESAAPGALPPNGFVNKPNRDAGIVNASATSGDAMPTVAAAASESTAPNKNVETRRGIDSNLTFRKLHARGKNVVVASQANKLESHMTDLQYDALTRKASMTNPLKSSFRTTRPIVWLKQDTTLMMCPEINFEHDQDGGIVFVTCRGAGTLQRFEELPNGTPNADADLTKRPIEFSAEWKKELRKFPDKESPYDIVELEGQAIIQQPNGENNWGLAAEYLRIWMDPLKRDKKATPKAAAASGAQKSKSPRLRFALAKQNVAFVNAEMQARTEALQVWFEERHPAKPLSLGSASRRSRDRLQPAAERQPRQRAIRPANLPDDAASLQAAVKNRRGNVQAFASTIDSPVRAAQQAPAPRDPTSNLPGNPASSPERPKDGPIEVDADLMQVRVLQGTSARDDTEVAEIWIKGNVRVKQEHGNGKEPLRMFGEQMHVANRSKTQKVIHIFGKPAHVQNQGVQIEGHHIELDQSANNALVKGAGRLQLPVTQSFDGKPLPTPLPLDIFWQEKMTFDGLTARFFGQVQSKMNDERMKNEMRCQEMQVVMTETVSFSGTRQQDGIRVRHVNCDGHVEFDSDEMKDSRVIDIRRIATARFSIDQTTGKTEAQGPGIIQRWQFGNERPQGLGPLSNVRPNAPAKPNTSEWTYTQVLFAGKMIGNMNQRSSTFHDDVKILYGPVEKATDTIDRHNLGENAGWMGCEMLTVTQHPETKTTPSYAELQARKNARLEGKTYNGRADSISYDGSKGQFVLRAEGNGTATIWTQKQIGGESTPNEAQQIEFNPRTNKLKLNQVSGLNWIQ